MRSRKYSENSIKPLPERKDGSANVEMIILNCEKERFHRMAKIQKLEEWIAVLNSTRIHGKTRLEKLKMRLEVEHHRREFRACQDHHRKIIKSLNWILSGKRKNIGGRLCFVPTQYK